MQDCGLGHGDEVVCAAWRVEMDYRVVAERERMAAAVAARRSAACQARAVLCDWRSVFHVKQKGGS